MNLKLGDGEVVAVVHQHGNPRPTMLNVHHDEFTSVDAGKANLAQFGGRLIELTHPGERLIQFPLAGKTYSFDPNRIFSDAGITATLQRHSTYDAGAHAAIKQFANEYLRRFELDREPVIVALHNTTEGVFSVEDFVPGGPHAAEAAAIHVSPLRSKFDFSFVTDQRFFQFLKERDFNVVLQNNDVLTDDGSLSVHFARQGIPYINVEAEIRHLKSQIVLLATVREMLRHFKLAV